MFRLPLFQDSDSEAEREFLGFDDDSSDEEDLTETETTTQHGGSKLGCKGKVDRSLLQCEIRLRQQYFSGTLSIHSKEQFTRRFRVPPFLFDYILHTLVTEEPEFQQKMDVCKRSGPSLLLKGTYMFRILGYGNCFNRMDNGFSISKSLAQK